ncbi:MAG: alpha/beta hydrolase [Candidatus Wallbacteria bacterium]|nr:alpha/beta hydrolase [Candidatus Wallbacteria bacterium]
MKHFLLLFTISFILSCQAAIPDPQAYDSGLITVPEDYSTPAGRTIEVYWERLKCSGTSQGAVICINGGPGCTHDTFHNLDMTTASYKEDHLSKLREKFDVYYFDQRGNGESSKIDESSMGLSAEVLTLKCCDNLKNLEGVLEIYLQDIGETLPTIEQLNALAGNLKCPCRGNYSITGDAQTGYRLKCDKHNTVQNPVTVQPENIQPAKLACYGTPNICRDIEEIRKQVIKKDRIVVFGESYGGMVALSYATLFPGSVEKLIIHDSAASDDYYTSLPANCDDNIKLLDGTIHQGIRNNYLTSIKKFDSQEVELPDGVNLSSDEFLALVRGLTYSMEGHAMVAKIVDEIARNGSSETLNLILQLMGGGTRTDRALEQNENVYKITVAQEMQDDKAVESAAAQNGTLEIYTYRWLDKMSCQGIAAFRKQSGLNQFTGYNVTEKFSQLKMPVLVFVGKFDPITPQKYAEQISKGIGSNCELVLLEKSAHAGLIEQNDLVIPKIMSFLTGKELPAEVAELNTGYPEIKRSFTREDVARIYLENMRYGNSRQSDPGF